MIAQQKKLSVCTSNLLSHEDLGHLRKPIVAIYKPSSVVELSRQMSSCKDLVVEPLQLGSLKGLNGTKDTRFILVRPLTAKVKAYDPVLCGIAYESITRERILLT